MVEMEDKQMTIDDVIESKSQEHPKAKKPVGYFPKLAKLEKDVARLERQIDIIIKSLRR